MNNMSYGAPMSDYGAGYGPEAGYGPGMPSAPAAEDIKEGK